MNDINNIHEKKDSIEDGSYFTESYNWYASRYLSAVSTRSYFIVLCTLAILGLSSLINQMLVEINASRYPFPIYALDQTKYYSQIHSISNPDESIEMSFAKYFVSTYVQYRENYNYNNFYGPESEAFFNKIKTFSSRKIYREYIDYMDVEQNSDSPIIKYKNKTIRNVVIKKVELRSSYAKVYFSSKEFGPFGVKEGDFISEINFQIDDIDEAFKRKDKVSFVVTGYKSYMAY